MYIVGMNKVQVIIHALNDIGINMSTIARYIGVSHITVRRWKTGENNPKEFIINKVYELAKMRLSPGELAELDAKIGKISEGELQVE